MDIHGPAPLPEWVATYNKAKAAGLIPDLSPSTLPVGGIPTYPKGTVLGAGGACAWTLTHCFGAYDVVDAPTGFVGLTFDDGPELASPVLYNYLKSQNQTATHFLIGSRVWNYPNIVAQAVANGEHIAAHTWSHPYMTTMTDMQGETKLLFPALILGLTYPTKVLGELGWANQVIYDQTGLVPAFWRPPYGDVDDRVRAIAKVVFDMYTVLWNHDTFDWSLTEGGGSALVGAGPQTDAGLDAELQGFYHLPKSPGLIILEHELTTRSVGGFVRNFATLKAQNWYPSNIPSIWGVPWYLNSATTLSGVYNNVTIGQGSTLVTNTSNAAAIPAPTAAVNQTTESVLVVTPTSTGVTATAIPVNVPVSTSSSVSSSAPVESATPASKASVSSAATLQIWAVGMLGLAALVMGIMA